MNLYQDETFLNISLCLDHILHSTLIMSNLSTTKL